MSHAGMSQTRGYLTSYGGAERAHSEVDGMSISRIEQYSRCSYRNGNMCLRRISQARLSEKSNLLRRVDRGEGRGTRRESGGVAGPYCT
jgi:hypothetical protein